MRKLKLLMAMKGDYKREPSKGTLFFAREMALFLRNYMDVYLIGEDRSEGEKGLWKGKNIGGNDFPFFDPYIKRFLPAVRPFDTFFVLRLALEKIKSINPDLLYLQEMDFLPLAKLSKPTALHIHGCFKEMLALRYPPLWRLREYLPAPRVNYFQGLFRLWLLKRYLPLLNKVFISANSGQIAYLKAKKPEIGVKLVPIPLSVNTRLFQPMERAKAREILELPQQHFIILFVGGLDPLKSPSLLLQSFALFKKHHPKSLLVFIGKGSLEEILRRQVENLGFEKDVLFMGKISNEKLPIFYNASNVFVLPSLYEGVSMVALEALACGTPIIVTPITGVSEFIEEGVQGFIVEGANIFSLTEALLKAVKLPSESRELCRQVALRFSSEKVGRMVHDNLVFLLS